MPQEQSSVAPVVLIVENDVLLRLVTASNLRDAGFEVIEAANPAEALRILDRIPVDVLFSDIDMQGNVDGLALGAPEPSSYENYTHFGRGEDAKRRHGIRVFPSQALCGEGC